MCDILSNLASENLSKLESSSTNSTGPCQLLDSDFNQIDKAWFLISGEIHTRFYGKGVNFGSRVDWWDLHIDSTPKHGDELVETLKNRMKTLGDRRCVCLPSCLSRNKGSEWLHSLLNTGNSKVRLVTASGLHTLMMKRNSEDSNAAKPTPSESYSDRKLAQWKACNENDQWPSHFLEVPDEPSPKYLGRFNETVASTKEEKDTLCSKNGTESDTPNTVQLVPMPMNTGVFWWPGKRPFGKYAHIFHKVPSPKSMTEYWNDWRETTRIARVTDSSIDPVSTWIRLLREVPFCTAVFGSNFNTEAQKCFWSICKNLQEARTVSASIITHIIHQVQTTDALFSRSIKPEDSRGGQVDLEKLKRGVNKLRTLSYTTVIQNELPSDENQMPLVLTELIRGLLITALNADQASTEYVVTSIECSRFVGSIVFSCIKTAIAEETAKGLDFMQEAPLSYIFELWKRVAIDRLLKVAEGYINLNMVEADIVK